ncbi:MAG TPA: DNA-processing protein DprA [Candidatus Limnocylindrales bacterium]
MAGRLMLGIGRRGPLGRADAPEVGGLREAGVDDGPGGPAPWPASGGTVLGTERDAWIVLAGVSGVGPVSFARLVAAFGSAGAVLAAARRTGAVAALVAATHSPDGGSPTLAPSSAAEIVAAAFDATPLLAPVRRSGVLVITLADEEYPRRLRRIDLPPPVLFLYGDPAALDRDHAVAIVGTRRPTTVGRETAGRIADAVGGLGATIVSGLALGIDAAAHAAAVRLGTPTVAVLGGGHERLYPAAHRGLARAIAAGGGAVVSEFHPDTVPTRGTFPRRNRIISGLADATVVVEAGARSGALTTAAWALEQGRGLHLVPGRLDDPAVAGCLAFLREAGPEARIVSGIPELLVDLDLVWSPATSTTERRPGAVDGPSPGGTSLEAVLATLGSAERAVAHEVAAGRGSVDELVLATGGPGAMVLVALTRLEVRGLVLETFGRYRAAGPLASANAAGRPRPGRGRAA